MFDAPGGERIDTMVLACTHFPLLGDELRDAFPALRFVDGGPGIARRIAYLTRDQPWPDAPPPGTAVFTAPGDPLDTLRAALARYRPPRRARTSNCELFSMALRRAEAKVAANSEGWALDYDRIFKSAIDRLHDEGRYRVFIDILRTKGSYPNARCFGGNGPKPITVWCSNDYLRWVSTRP